VSKHYHDAIHWKTLDMNQASHMVSSTTPSGNEALCIDPQLLRLDGYHNALASPSTLNTISTAGNQLGVTSAFSDETAAGRG
jgi:hypothetical protein